MAKPTLITSPANPVLKDIRRAIAKGSLTRDGLLVAETFHLLEEALRSNLDVPVIIAADGVRMAMENHVHDLTGVRVMFAPDSLVADLGATETAQGVIALVRPRQWKLEDLFAGIPLVLVLDGIRDPGNAGSIVRAAEAFGASGILFLKGSVSPFNAKTIRASAGSLFRVPFVSGIDAELVKETLRQRKLRVYAADPRGDVAIGGADLRSPAGFIIGSEGHGISDGWKQGSVKVRIPTRGVESLNAAMAAGVILYEAYRQRSQVESL